MLNGIRFGWPNRTTRIKALVRGAIFIAIALLPAQATVASDPATSGSRLLRYPDINGSNIVFTYAGDLWTVPRSGGTAWRLTANPGFEEFAKYSPDGKWIAFSGEYDGNLDVYLMPAQGGEPRRLTFHPAADVVVGWTPDSKRVLFHSDRSSFSFRFDKLFTVSIDGGLPDEMPLPAGGLSSFSPDASMIAYNRVSTEFRTWKRYRGGWQQFISLYDFKKNSYDEVPHGLASDMFPMWHGDAVYFDSDRDGTMNLYKFDIKTREITQLTRYKEYDVKWPSLGGGDDPCIVYENGGFLYTFDLGSQKIAPVPISIESDMSWSRPEFVNVSKNIMSFGLSPSGARAVFEARGDVFTVPAKKGDIRNITDSQGVRELWPAWSPDGKWIAYFSDRTGEYELYVRAQDGSGQEKRITTDSHAYRYGPKWSPDSTRLLFAEKNTRFFYVDINEGKPVLVDESRDGPINQYDWSSDGKWIAYAKNGDNTLSRIYLYSVDQRKSFPVTDGTTNDYSPVFDPGGKYLYFLGDRNFNPSFSGFELGLNFGPTKGIYAVTLAADTPSPFAPESDEEKGTAKPDEKGQPTKGAGGEQKASKDTEATGQASAKPEPPKSEGQKPPEPVKVDIDGIDQRIVHFPVQPGTYAGLHAAPGFVFYLAMERRSLRGPQQGTVHAYDLAKREDNVLLAGIMDYDIDLKGDKVIYQAGPVNYGIVDAHPGQKVGDGALDLSGMTMKLDPRAEWKQIFNEAWRIERDFYYDPAMRGLDWAAIKARYEQELPYVGHRADLNYLIGEMIAELSTSHAYVGGGDAPEAKHVQVGLLGADFAISDGYYRFKKIYKGDNSADETRAPLTEPGVAVHEGDFLLAVNGKPLKATDNVYSFFENTVGKQVTLTVNDKPTMEKSRTVIVRPIGDEMALRNLDWVENNARKVYEATGGRCGYMYVPDTAVPGMQSFARAFFSQTNKDAMIIDERWNSGGFIPDFFVEHLSRQPLGFVAPRDTNPTLIPAGAMYGPKVMLANEFSGSGGDAFPYFFREYRVGPIVGKRTWGGLVGINGGLPMVDGGFVTAPQFGFYIYKDGKTEWIVENKGVSPDYDVDARPDLVISGHDPQLERAIELVNQGLSKAPAAHPGAPAFIPAVKSE